MQVLCFVSYVVFGTIVCASDVTCDEKTRSYMKRELQLKTCMSDTGLIYMEYNTQDNAWFCERAVGLLVLPHMG